MSTREDDSELVRQTQAVWEHIAAWWDAQVGEGDSYQNELVLPATERLLGPWPGEHVLDLACGNGLFARRLAARGARVLACDFSPTFLERARARTTEHADRIDYRLVDLTDRDQVLRLGACAFDAAVCGMALMDMAAITPLLEGLAVLLRPGGRFVFSLLHPCFNSTGTTMLAEVEDKGGVLRTTHAVKVVRYLGLGPQKGLGKPGQPAPQYYFNRPLSVLFSACFRAGFVMTGIEEPAFPAKEGTHPLSWRGLPEIPPILVVRMELPAARPTHP